MFNIPLYEMFVHVIVGTIFSILMYLTANSFDINIIDIKDLNIYFFIAVFYFTGLIIERFSSSIFEYLLRFILPKKMKDHKEILRAKITSKRYEIHIRNYAMNRSFIVTFLIILIYTLFTKMNIMFRFQLIIVYISIIIIFTLHSIKLIGKINDYYQD